MQSSTKKQEETPILSSNSPSLTNLVKISLSSKKRKFSLSFYIHFFIRSIQISIKNYIVPRGSVTPGILGQSVYQFNDSNFLEFSISQLFFSIATGYLFNTFSIRGNETSVITLSAQGSFDNTFIDQVLYIFPSLFSHSHTRLNY